jgi:hypothetical protein
LLDAAGTELYICHSPREARRMGRAVKRLLMLVVIGVILWGAANKPRTRTTHVVPERVIGTWRLADEAVAPEGGVRAFRLGATQVVPLDSAGRELRAYPVVEVAIRSGREAISRWLSRLYFGPRVEQIRVHFGRPHPTLVADQRLDVDPLGNDRICSRHGGQASERWPEDANEYVRITNPH